MVAKRKDDELAERLLEFAVRIIHLCGHLPRSTAGNHVSGQLVGAGTSPGANYEEARGAHSLADFISKLSIVLKELKESRYWIKVIIKVPLLTSEKALPLLNECEELIAIIAKSIFTARQPKKKLAS
jgi:four helix bundle protein